MTMNGARARLPGLHVEWERLLMLAGATLLLASGVFSAWQTWLIADQGGASQQVHVAQDQTVQALAADIAQQRSEVTKAIAGVDVSDLPASSAQVLASLKQHLPQALNVELYTAGLDEVLHANYRDFGYAKAAQLMAAPDVEGEPPVESQFKNVGDRHLTMVEPLGSQQKPAAWVWIELPFAPIAQRFSEQSVDGGQLQLHQSTDYGENLELMAHGSSAAIDAEPVGKPIPGSSFNIVAVLPGAYIVLPQSVLLAALLTLLSLGAGAYLFWLFAHGPAHRTVSVEEEGLSDVAQTQSPPEPAKPVVRLAPRPAPAPVPAPAAVTVDPAIFRTYDIRGVVGKSLTEDVARLLGQSIGMLMREKGLHEMVIGRDGRLSGPELAGALSDGLRATGIDVIDLGAVPTPVVYYAAYRFNTGCGVAVTGSHNPPDYNGFKIVVGGETLSEGAIQDLYQRIVANALDHDGKGSLRHVDVVPDYIERITSDVQTERPLKLVVDCGNGIPGAVAPQVLEGIGCQVIPLYCEVDGNFPNHHPDPSDPHNLEDLILAVKQTGADLGLAFDGDGDRLGVVTRSGEIIFPDRTLMLFARDVLSRQPGATIIYDVKCTGHLKGQILDAGGSPLMWRTGHSLIKAKMRETGAELAGEMSGHFFFKERWYGFDDGIYAGARLLEILAGDIEGRTPEQIFATCPKGVSTPELKVEMSEGEHYRFIEKFREKAHFGDATLITIDGVRADWVDGWGLVRPSNTTPILVLRFDADNEQALKRIKNTFREQMLAVDASLKLPF
ncbi:phosphomannomutase/phosphoglucomutase [Dyella sp. M7H15-1]|uniref:phosphomannomutase/phosphoglucomutase n=1 Tax=Dyella sp. M7H15-1 TaxID=2501295 RepID=UPI0010050A19|nr:phosphomannomutase/phosphoglucomutase [Dyella sp. M7H15-1]QAU24679.1 phosphomannomutase/phosphoglucomutase [Dyella sp. M7H15-1]